MPLLRAVSFEGTAAALLHWNHDDDVDFMKEVYCALSKLPEWLIVVVTLSFLWSTISASSVTGTVGVGVQQVLLIYFVTTWPNTRKCFTWIIK